MTEDTHTACAICGKVIQNGINMTWDDFDRPVHFACLEDDIDHPEHYTAGGIEVIDVIKAKLTEEQFVGYLKGSAIKYILRSGHKHEHEKDLRKCIWFTQYLVDEGEEE
jgi:hypothetical protein